MPSAQLALAACYYAVSLICGLQVSTILYYGHQLRSFRVGFLLLSLTWTALKGVFWLDVEGWTLLEWVLFSKLPTCGQLASYLFFLIFCAEHVHRSSWAEKHSRRCWLFFAAANIFSLGSVVGFTALALAGDDGSGSAATAEQQRDTTLGLVFSAAVYAILGASLAMYGWLIWARNLPASPTAAAAAAAAAGSKRGSWAEPGSGGAAAPTQISFKTGFVKKDEKVSGIVPVLVAVCAACSPAPAPRAHFSRRRRPCIPLRRSRWSSCSGWCTISCSRSRSSPPSK